jgi:hypothetical protein
MVVSPTQPTSGLAALYSLESSYQQHDQIYQDLISSMSLTCEGPDAAQCTQAMQTNRQLQALIASMVPILKSRKDSASVAQLLRLEQKQNRLVDDFESINTKLKDTKIITDMYQARYITYALGFLFVAGLCLRA